MKKIQIILCVILLLLCTSCTKSNEQYQFPLEGDDVQKVLDNLNLDWGIEDVVYGELSNQIIVSLKSDDDIYYGVSTSTPNNNKALSINWLLPREFSKEQLDAYYDKDILDIFNFTIDLYDNNKQMKKAFNEFLKYYDEFNEDHESSIYWVKRVGDEHLKIIVRDFTPQSQTMNRLGSILILKSEQYEESLRKGYENWKENFVDKTLPINEVSVEEIKKFEKIEDEESFYGYQLILKGHLKNIKEQKNLPESIKNKMPVSYKNLYSGNYLKAELIDGTGSVDVFLPMTSLNKKELEQERNYGGILLYDGDSPAIFVRSISSIE